MAKRKATETTAPATDQQPKKKARRMKVMTAKKISKDNQDM